MDGPKYVPLSSAKIMSEDYAQGWNPSRYEAVSVARVPLVLTTEGYDGPVPDKLVWIAPDGTRTEYAIVDRARLERICRLAAAAFALNEMERWPTPSFAADEWTAITDELPSLFREAVAAIQPGDLNPLP